MIIAIDASKTWSKKKTGVENMVYQIILNLSKVDDQNTYYLYSNNEIPKELTTNKNFIPKIIPFPRLWNKFRLPLALMRDKPERFLALNNCVPAYAPKNSIVFIHDLAFKYFPKAYSSYELFLQESAIEADLKRASKIIFSLNANKEDFKKFYSFPNEKLEVAELAYNDEIYKKLDKSKEILKIDSPFFLYVGRLEKRKNALNIIEAFKLFKDKSQTNHKLVLVGNPGFGSDDIKKKIDNSNLKDDIVLAGYIAEKDLVHIYNRCEAFIFPSLYEGFGLPILEAFASGAPVITSNIPTIKEVTQDAAILVDPEKPEDISLAMKNIIENKKLRKDLVEKGAKRAKDFNWQKTAKKILDIIVL